MPMGPPHQIHKIFMNFLLLKEINKEEKGISGYKLKKRVNLILENGFGEKTPMKPPKLSQSSIYRLLSEFKEKNLLEEKKVVIKNRNQILYNLNQNGKKRLNYLSKIIDHLTPEKSDKLKVIEDFFSGKILPFELFPGRFPKDKLLENLKKRRETIINVLNKISKKIEELENELSK